MDMPSHEESGEMGGMFNGSPVFLFHSGWLVHGALMSFAVFMLLPFAISLKFRAGYMHRHGLVQLAMLTCLTLGALYMHTRPHDQMEEMMAEQTDLESTWARQHGFRGWVLLGVAWLQGLVGFGKAWVKIPCCVALTRWRIHARFGYLLAFCLVLQACYAWPENVKQAICPKYACFEGYPISGHMLVAVPTMGATIHIIVTNWEREVNPETTFQVINRGLVVFMGIYLFVDGLTYGFPNMGEHSMFIWNGIACYLLAQVLAKKAAVYPLSRVPYVLMFLILGGSFLTDPHQLTDPVSGLTHKVVGAFFFVGSLLLLLPNVIAGCVFIYLGGFCFLCAMPQLCKLAFLSRVMPYSYVSGISSLGIMVLAFHLTIWVVPPNTQRVPLWTIEWPTCLSPKSQGYVTTGQDECAESSESEGEALELKTV